jgi:hypothetical protein
VFKVTTKSKTGVAETLPLFVAPGMELTDAVRPKRVKQEEPEPITDNQVMRHYKAKVRRAKAVQKVQRSGDLLASYKQKNLLRKLLGFPPASSITAFVAFANCYNPTKGYLQTRTMYAEAISLCIDGFNSWGTAQELVQHSFGEELGEGCQPEGETDQEAPYELQGPLADKLRNFELDNPHIL